MQVALSPIQGPSLAVKACNFFLIDLDFGRRSGLHVCRGTVVKVVKQCQLRVSNSASSLICRETFHRDLLDLFLFLSAPNISHGIVDEAMSIWLILTFQEFAKQYLERKRKRTSRTSIALETPVNSASENTCCTFWKVQVVFVHPHSRGPSLCRIRQLQSHQSRFPESSIQNSGRILCLRKDYQLMSLLPCSLFSPHSERKVLELCVLVMYVRNVGNNNFDDYEKNTYSGNIKIPLLQFCG